MPSEEDQSPERVEAEKDAPQMEHRTSVFPMPRLKIGAPDADGRRRIQGFASIFGNRDSQGDIVVKGAFARTLKEREDVKVLWQHDRARPIGKQESAYENDQGLAVTGVLSDTSFVRDEVLPLVKDGVVNGLSIGYDVAAGGEEQSKDGNLLKDLELFEWSIVTFPANERARVTEVKSVSIGDAQGDAHADRLLWACKQARHELEWFASEDRMNGLDLQPMLDLRLALRGLPGTKQGDAAYADVIELAYLSGMRDMAEILDPKESADERDRDSGAFRGA
jgi:HK97 family phage prohead protease